MQQNKTILLVEDHNLFRRAVANLLKSFGYETLEAPNGKAGLALLKDNAQKIDLIITDLQMPVMDGYEFAQETLSLFPEQKIIVLTMHESHTYIEAMIKLGVQSYLIKNVEPEELQLAIQEVLKGAKYFQRHVMELVVHNMASNHPAAVEFSDRELEILNLIAAEKTVAEIAAALSISSRTVESHKLRMLEKAGVKSTIGLIKKALEGGLLKS